MTTSIVDIEVEDSSSTSNTNINPTFDTCKPRKCNEKQVSTLSLTIKVNSQKLCKRTRPIFHSNTKCNVFFIIYYQSGHPKLSLE